MTDTSQPPPVIRHYLVDEAPRKPDKRIAGEYRDLRRSPHGMEPIFVRQLIEYYFTSGPISISAKFESLISNFLLEIGPRGWPG